MSNPVPRPGIMGIDPYVGGESSLDGRDKIIKFEGCYHGHADGLLAAAGSGATLNTLG